MPQHLIDDHEVEPTLEANPSEEALLPKMPRLMRTVYKQIEEHPDFPAWYNTPSGGNATAYQAAKNGWSARTRENNRWIRSLWRHLYWGEPEEE